MNRIGASKDLGLEEKSHQDGPETGLQAGTSRKPNRRCGKTVMSGSGMQTRTPGAYLVAEAGPGCTQ